MVSVASNALTALDTVKEILGGSAFTDRDALLTRLINAFSNKTRAYCDRLFHRDTLTRYFDGDGNSELWLPLYPIISITEFNIDTGRDFNSGTELTIDDDYVKNDDEGILELLGTAVFPKGKQGIKVVWTGGYSTIPDDVDTAVAIWVASFIDRATQDGVKHIRTPDFSLIYEEPTGEPPGLAKSLLQSYRRYSFGGQPHGAE